MDRETIKDRRAQLNAMTDQLDAAVRNRLMQQPRPVLEVVAEELKIDHVEMGKSELASAIIDKVAANISDIRISEGSDE